MVDAARARRLAEQIKVLTATALERVVKDPDLGFVTITDVRVTPDLASAKSTTRYSAISLRLSKLKQFWNVTAEKSEVRSATNLVFG